MEGWRARRVEGSSYFIARKLKSLGGKVKVSSTQKTQCCQFRTQNKDSRCWVEKSKSAGVSGKETQELGWKSQSKKYRKNSMSPNSHPEYRLKMLGGRMEGGRVKGGRVEGWRVEGWKGGRVEGWRVEGWRARRVEGSSYFIARKLKSLGGKVKVSSTEKMQCLQIRTQNTDSRCWVEGWRVEGWRVEGWRVEEWRVEGRKDGGWKGGRMEGGWVEGWRVRRVEGSSYLIARNSRAWVEKSK